MTKNETSNDYALYAFSIIVSIVAYGFTLGNYSLTVDSEVPIYPDYSMGLGRWGTNLVRYHIFNGLLPYATLLIGLVFLCLTAVEITKIFRLKKIYAFIFCALFLTLPQHAYQLAFTMQADAVPIGFFSAIVGVSLFISNIKEYKQPFSLLKLMLSCLLIVFSIAVYQALVFIPVIVFIIYFFQNAFNPIYDTKDELKIAGLFSLLMIVSGVLYYVSVKVLCPPVEAGYLSTYASGNSDSRFVDFYNLLVDHFRGNFYYGEKTYVLASLTCLAILIIIFRNRQNAILKIASLAAMMIGPYIISFFITNGSHPPRLYVASPIVFGFLITFLVQHLNQKYVKKALFGILVLVLCHIYFITNLFYSNYKIFNHDVAIAKNINNIITQKYQDFNPNINYVYFYGSMPMSNYDKLEIPNTDVFSGSLFRWDGGNNWRIINFFRVNDIAYYKFLDDKDSFEKIKDSIASLPVWPNPESVKKIDNVVIVKIGNSAGVPLPFQQ